MPGLRDWWRHVIGAVPGNPSEEFEDAAHQAEDRSERIDALELRVKLIERRLKITNGYSSRDSQSA